MAYCFLLVSGTKGQVDQDTSKMETSSADSSFTQPIDSMTQFNVDTTQAFSKGNAENPIDESKIDSLDKTILGQISSLNVLIDSLEQLNRSLQSENERLSLAASRRLSMDVFTDSFRSFLFYTCVVNPQKVSIQLFNQKEKKRKAVHTFSSIEKMANNENKQLMFAMNGGMFEPNRLAKGLLVLEGNIQQPLDTLTEGYGNFYLQPNGVFVIDSSQRGYVVTTQEYQTLKDSVNIWYATQSGPMMVHQGEINPIFNDGSPNRHIRNAVGITPEGHVVFAISRRRVTFYELSSFMIRQGCTNVLYLDGAISKAYLSELEIGDIASGNQLGPIIAIFQ